MSITEAAVACGLVILVFGYILYVVGWATSKSDEW